jgi:hypothetical protein
MNQRENRIDVGGAVILGMVAIVLIIIRLSVPA